MKKTIYLITPHFPPIHNVASLRMLAFVKYLDKDKFSIHIICSFQKNRNLTVLEKKYHIKIHQMNSLPLRLKFYPNENRLWHNIKAAFNKLLGLVFLNEDPLFLKKSKHFLKNELKKETLQPIIITSFAPLSCLKVGLELKKERQSFFWISDIRDEISQAPGLPIYLNKYLLRIEKKMVRHADIITSVSKPILDWFKNLSQKYEPSPLFLEIRNGFDFTPSYNLSPTPENQIKIIFTGSFYGDIKPYNFFQALEKVISIFPNLSFKMDVVGNRAPLTIPHSLSNIVNQLPPSSYEQIPSLLEKSDILLVLHPSKTRKGVYLTKTFDYLATNKPILGLLDPNDVAAKLIKEANAGVVTPNEDIDGITSALTRLIHMKLEGKVFERNWNIINDHHRSKQVKRLEENLLKVLTF